MQLLYVDKEGNNNGLLTKKRKIKGRRKKEERYVHSYNLQTQGEKINAFPHLQHIVVSESQLWVSNGVIDFSRRQFNHTSPHETGHTQTHTDTHAQLHG